MLSTLVTNLVQTNFLFPFSNFNLTQHVINKVIKIECGVRRDVGPACNVVGFVDHFIFGLKHMKNHATYQHIPSCSLHSLNYGGLPLNAPNQCGTF